MKLSAMYLSLWHISSMGGKSNLANYKMAYYHDLKITKEIKIFMNQWM